MDRIFEALRPFIRWVVRRSGIVLVAALLLSGVGLFFAQRLHIDTDLANLIPPDYPSVQALETLRETVGGESDVAMAIESPSFEANKSFAEALIPRVLALQGAGRSEPYFSRVEYRRDTEFLKDNALYFASPEELDRLEAYLEERLEEAKLEANPFYFDLEDEEDDEAAAIDSTGEELAEAYERIVGTEYPISKDSTALVLRFYPTGSQTNIGLIEAAYRDLDSLVAAMEPASFHPEMEVTLAGRLFRQLVEVRAITRDVFGSFGVGVTAVLLLVVLYFSYKAYRARAGRHVSGKVLLSVLARAPVMALLIGLPLLMSLAWTFGVAYLTFGVLNLMTSTLGLVLFGLGIDYGIHFYARYTEERGAGHDVEAAAETTFVSTGQAITVGALTTAAALYVLVIADFRGFSEFGFIAGTGIIFALLAMTVVLPALIAVCERFGLLKLETARVAEAAGARAVRTRFPGATGVVLASLAAVALALVFLPRVSFEYEFGRLEPEYEEYNVRQDRVSQVYTSGGRRNPAYVVVEDAAEVPAVVAALREKAAQDTLSPTILEVESLQDRFPLWPEAQQRRLARLAEIRALLDDPFLRAEESEELDRLRRAAQTQAPIAIDEVPENLRKRFASKSGEIGNFVIIYPSVGLSSGLNSIAFSDDVGTIVTEDGTVYHAGSTSLVAADMLRLMQAEAPWMVLATFVVVGLLMWVNFRSVRWALLALLPLVVGLLWMLLLMEAFSLKLNFYNLVVLPAVLGIGNDAGVHMVHRYREEGRGSLLHVLRSTGEHVTMGSLTTMVGFGGLLLSFHPGLRSIGELAVVGVGTTLLAALLFLPALLQWLEDRPQRAVVAEGAP
jgi:predicted RND superfamily exporter protein